MRKTVLLIINLILLVVIVFGIVVLFKDKVQNNNVLVENNSEKLSIATTLFPEYDFVKNIVGDKANVSLVLKSGVETHNFEPTEQNIIAIDSADLLITLREELEPWTKEISSSIRDKDKIINISKNVNLMCQNEFDEDHGHEHNHNHSEESLDSHIWLSLSNSKIMVNDLLNEIVKIDPENQEFYKNNANKYIEELDKLDKEYKDFFNENKDIVLVFGGEFAYSYLMKEYNINFASVFTNCGHGEDPSIARVKNVIDIINEKNIPVVFYQELSEGVVAKMIAEETNAESKVLYTLHNGNIIGENPDTYLELMRKNLENIKTVVNSK